MRVKVVNIKEKLSYLEEIFGFMVDIEPHFPIGGGTSRYRGHVAITKSLTPSKKTEYTIKLALPKSDMGIHPTLSKVGTRRVFRAYMMIIFFMMREGSCHTYVEDSDRYPDCLIAGKDKFNRVLVNTPYFNDTVLCYERESLVHFKNVIDFMMGVNVVCGLRNSERLPYYLNTALPDPRELEMDAVVDIEAENLLDLDLQGTPALTHLLGSVKLPIEFTANGLSDIYGIFEAFFGNLKITSVTDADDLVTVQTLEGHTTLTIRTDGLVLYEEFYYVCVGLSHLMTRKDSRKVFTVRNKIRDIYLDNKCVNRRTRIWDLAPRLVTTVLAAMSHPSNLGGLFFVFREITRLRVQYECSGKYGSFLRKNLRDIATHHDLFKLHIFKQAYPYLMAKQLSPNCTTLVGYSVETPSCGKEILISYRPNSDRASHKSVSLQTLYLSFALFLACSADDNGDFTVKFLRDLSDDTLVLTDTIVFNDTREYSPSGSEVAQDIMMKADELSNMTDVGLSWVLLNRKKDEAAVII